jgi:hypothetical protein
MEKQMTQVCGVATIEPPAAFVAVRHRFNRPPDVAEIQLVSDTSRVVVRNVTAEGFEIAVGEVPRSCLSVLWRFDPAPRAPVSSAPEEPAGLSITAAPPPKSVADRLIERIDRESKAYAQRVGGDVIVEMAYARGMLERELRDRIAEVDRLNGNGAKPQAGCGIVRVEMGAARVLVEFEMEPGERPVYDVESPVCGPGCGPTVSIIQAFVNGEWVDPEDYFADTLIAKWEQQVLDGGVA